MSSRGGLARAVGVMFSGTFVSRGLGFLRAALLTLALASAGGAADAFAVANTLPNTIYMLLAGGVINAVFVPQLVRSAKRADGGQDYANRLLTVAGTALLLVTLVMTAGSVLLVNLYAGDLSADWQPIAYAFAFWCVPQVFFYGMYTLLGQVLNAREVFGPYMWAPVVNNIIAIGGIAVYLWQFGRMSIPIMPAEDFGSDRIVMLGATATAGVALQAIVLIIPLWRSGFRYRPRWGLEGLSAAGRMGGWTFAALAVGQLGFIVVSRVAAAAGAQGTPADPLPGNNAYQLAFTVFMLPQSLIVVSVVTAMFTRLSKRASSRDGAGVRDDLSLSIRTVSVFTILAGVVMATLATPLARAITLDAQPAAQTMDLGLVIMAFAVGVPGLALWSVIQRVYYAYEDAKSLFWIQIAMAGIVAGGAILASVMLHPAGWVMGTALAISTSYYVGALVGYVGLRRRLLSLDGSRILRTNLRLILAAVPTALVGVGIGSQVELPGLFGAIAQLVVGGAVMVAVYLVMAQLLKISEVTAVTARARRLLSRIPGMGSNNARTMAESRGTGRQTSELTGDAEVLDDALTRGMVLAGRYRVDQLRPSPIPGVRAWLGRDTILDRRVDVLSVSGENAEEVLEGARRTALITDPHLPKILRVGEFDGTGYVVLNPFPATTVADLLEYGALPEPIARSIAGETARAIEAGRRRGVHHLGLTPELIGLTPDGGVQILGLGIAGPAQGPLEAGVDATRQDAQSVADLYRQMTNDEGALTFTDEDVKGATSLELALAPWGAVPTSVVLREEVGAPREPIAVDETEATRVLQAGVGDIIGQSAQVSSSWHPDVANVTPPPDFDEVLAPPESEPERDLAEAGAEAGAATEVDVETEGEGTDADRDSEAAEHSEDSEGDAEASEDVDAPVAESLSPKEDADDEAAAVPAIPAALAIDAPPEETPVVGEVPVAGEVPAWKQWARRLDEAIPAETPPTEETTSEPSDDQGAPSIPASPRDSSTWSLPAFAEFAGPPSLDAILDSAAETGATESDPDAVAQARHRSDVDVTALAAWLAGRREQFQARREQQAAERAEIRAEQEAAAAQEQAAVAAQEAEAAAHRQHAEAAAAIQQQQAELAALEQQRQQTATAPTPTTSATATSPGASDVFDVEADPSLWSRPATPQAAPTTQVQPSAPSQAYPRSGSAPFSAPPATSSTDSDSAASAGGAGQGQRDLLDATGYQVPASRTRTWGNINATPYVLIVMLIAVVWVLFLAIGSLLDTARSQPEPTEPTNPGLVITPEPSEGATDGEAPADSGEEPAEDGEPPAEGQAPADEETAGRDGQLEATDVSPDSELIAIWWDHGA